MDQLARRWLAKAPGLLTAYLVWVNRGRRGRGLSAALVLSFVWMGTVWIFVYVDRAGAISTLAWLNRHELFWASIFAVGAGVLVSRRRALNRIAASRSWIAALPVERSIARWQAIAVASVPALVLIGVSAFVFGNLSFIALVAHGIPASLVTWAATTGGVVLGAGLSYLVPSAGQEPIYESSRYVPHRRRAGTPIPTGSLSGLGNWPVRHMFANARPKTIARAMIPILLSVPLGSTAANAILVIGLLTALGALVLLVAAVISVSAKASGWLKPLPLESDRLLRRTLIPALAFMFCVTAIETWLIWLLGSSVAQSVAAGVLTLVVSAIFAVAASLISVYATTKGSNDRS